MERPKQDQRPGRVLETRGRRVLVGDDEGERVCFLSGQRAVVGDRVRWVPAQGTGGKVVSVEERDTVLERVDVRGKRQVLASNLHGILVVVAGVEPPFKPGLVDRYLVAAASSGLAMALCINKSDQGVPEEVEAAVAVRANQGMDCFRVSALLSHGVDGIRGFLSAQPGPWAFVGHSGVGKTSLIRTLLPGVEVGAVGELSSYWGTGQHTTTSSRLFSLPGGGEIVDSPGIRTFTPGGMTPETVRSWFPGVAGIQCKYRDCQHRPDESGCCAEDEAPAALLESYRRLLEDVRTVGDRNRR